jgi:hypothetical protein
MLTFLLETKIRLRIFSVLLTGSPSGDVSRSRLSAFHSSLHFPRHTGCFFLLPRCLASSSSRRRLQHWSANCSHCHGGCQAYVRVTSWPNPPRVSNIITVRAYLRLQRTLGKARSRNSTLFRPSEYETLRGLSPRANYTYRRLQIEGCRVVSAADPLWPSIF